MPTPQTLALSGCVVVPELLWRSHIEASRGENDPDTSILWRHIKEYYWRESDNQETSQLPNAKKAQPASQLRLFTLLSITCRPEPDQQQLYKYSLTLSISIGTGVGLFSEKVRHPTPKLIASLRF